MKFGGLTQRAVLAHLNGDGGLRWHTSERVGLRGPVNPMPERVDEQNRELSRGVDGGNES